MVSKYMFLLAYTNEANTLKAKTSVTPNSFSEGESPIKCIKKNNSPTTMSVNSNPLFTDFL